MKKKPFAFKLAIFLGVVLLGSAVALMLINPKPEGDNVYGGFRTPIIALEFATQPRDIEQLFSVTDPEDYERQFLLGNWIDYGFMAIYSSLLFCIAFGIYRITRSGTLWLAFLLCLFILAGDAFENLQIFNILQHYKTGDITPYLSWMHLFTWIKWGSIASVFLLLSPFFLRGSIFHKIIGLFQLACFGLAVTAFFLSGPVCEWFALSVSVNFLLLFIFAITFRPVKA